MQSMPAFRPTQVGDKVLAASRQVWLAGLGAAVVTRDWAGKEAGNVFRNLVREGSQVETRALRFVGQRLETTVTQANTVMRRARRTIVRYADSAVTMVRDMPVVLPRVELAAFLRKEKVAPRRPAKARRPAAKAAKSAKLAKPATRARKTTRAKTR